MKKPDRFVNTDLYMTLNTSKSVVLCGVMVNKLDNKQWLVSSSLIKCHILPALSHNEAMHSK